MHKFNKICFHYNILYQNKNISQIDANYCICRTNKFRQIKNWVFRGMAGMAEWRNGGMVKWRNGGMAD